MVIMGQFQLVITQPQCTHRLSSCPKKCHGRSNFYRPRIRNADWLFQPQQAKNRIIVYEPPFSCTIRNLAVRL